MKDIPLKKIPDKYWESFAQEMVRTHLNGYNVGNCEKQVVKLLASTNHQWYKQGQHDLMVFLDTNLHFFLSVPTNQWEHLKLQWSKEQGVKSGRSINKNKNRTRRK